MNKVWNRLAFFGATGEVHSGKREKRLRPYTMGFEINVDGNVEDYEIRDGDVRDFSKFKSKVNVLNVIHKNGRTTVIKK